VLLLRYVTSSTLLRSAVEHHLRYPVLHI
jgi:hypothetical protein